ncbi:hypothetical protein HZH66_009646 [Vespula vulgaris]|uniref:Uncharacterized protein n=1 Tax=Vespula vulgaris TaxID=7454 RepID=A0A834JPE4_VESVU|nr:hypothetical protein HZH66_009646 [Vespula vulgaris]
MLVSGPRDVRLVRIRGAINIDLGRSDYSLERGFRLLFLEDSSLSLTFSITPTSASPEDLEDSNKLDVKRRKLVN